MSKNINKKTIDKIKVYFEKNGIKLNDIKPDNKKDKNSRGVSLSIK